MIFFIYIFCFTEETEILYTIMRSLVKEILQPFQQSDISFNICFSPLSGGHFLHMTCNMVQKYAAKVQKGAGVLPNSIG